MRSGPQALSTESEFSKLKTACGVKWTESIKSGLIIVQDLTAGNRSRSSTVKTELKCLLKQDALLASSDIMESSDTKEGIGLRSPLINLANSKFFRNLGVIMRNVKHMMFSMMQTMRIFVQTVTFFNVKNG